MMMEQTEIEEETSESGNALLSGLRRVLMAGVGAVALTQEQIEDFVGKLVERGEIADGDAQAGYRSNRSASEDAA